MSVFGLVGGPPDEPGRMLRFDRAPAPAGLAFKLASATAIPASMQMHRAASLTVATPMAIVNRRPVEMTCQWGLRAATGAALLAPGQTSRIFISQPAAVALKVSCQFLL